MRLKSLTVLLPALLVCLNVSAAEPGKLLIWINADKGHGGLQQVATRFTEATGIAARVEHPDDLAKKFEEAARNGSGPDIILWPQDRLGDFIAKGLVVPVEPPQALREALVSVGWDAFTVGGRTWGYPVGAEAIMLLYNKALITAPPSSFEEIETLDSELGKRGIKAIGWDYTNAYFSWPLLAANGGYVFKRQPDGSYDTADIGIDNAGALAGGRLLRRFIDSGVLPQGGMPGDAAQQAMHAGKQAMWITGPWSWEGLRRAGVDFGVAPLPTVDGQPARPFVGVMGAMIAAQSPNGAAAKQFIEGYLLDSEGLRTVNADKPIGVPLNKRLFWDMVTDEHLRISMDGVTFGRPMPSAPQMSSFWEAANAALLDIAQGTDEATALGNAARQMRGEEIAAEPAAASSTEPDEVVSEELEDMPEADPEAL